MEKERLNKLNDRDGKELFKDKLKSFFSRCGQDTPPFFKKLRIVGLVITATGATLLAAPIALPTIVVTVAGYLAVSGAVATAVSQAVITEGGDDDCDDPSTGSGLSFE